MADGHNDASSASSELPTRSHFSFVESYCLSVQELKFKALGAEDAYWIGQALVNHGFLRRSRKEDTMPWQAMHAAAVDVVRLKRS